MAQSAKRPENTAYYETDTLSVEYHRDRANDPDYPLPRNYFPGDDSSRAPPNLWRHTATQTPLRGSVGVDPEANERGERTIRLNRMVADRLGATRGPGESIDDVILRIAAEG